MNKQPDKSQYAPPGLYPGFGSHSNVARVQRLEEGAQRLQGGAIRPTTGTYARIPAQSLTTRSNGQQFINITNSRVLKRGGISPSGNTAGFAFTATTTTITWYWDGTNGSQVPVITRADGSRFTVPTSGSGLTISGLNPSTTYYFLPFWNVNNLCNIGWVGGTIGTPKIAFVLADTVDTANAPVYGMAQTLQGNEALTNGFMSAVTTAAGSGSGLPGGGGAGGSGCVRAGTEIKTLGGLDHVEELTGNYEWIHLRIADGRELYCTYDHPLYHATEGKVRADRLVPEEMVITDSGEQRIVTAEFAVKACSKITVRMKTGHLFWANGFLSHNKFNTK